jgi:hypothetical protein
MAVNGWRDYVKVANRYASFKIVNEHVAEPLIMERAERQQSWMFSDSDNDEKEFEPLN